MNISQPLYSKRLCLRNYTEQDLPFLAEMWFDEENGKYLSDPTKDYIDEPFRKALETLGESTEGYYLVITLADTGERIGSACMFPSDDGRIFDIGYCIHKTKQQRGYGSEAVRRLLVWLKEQGAQKVTAEVAVANIPSNQLLRRLGFTVEEETSFRKYNMDVQFSSYIYALNFI